MRKLSKKEALVYKTYKDNLEAAMMHLQGKSMNTLVKPLELQAEGVCIRVEKKDVLPILENLIHEGILFKQATSTDLLAKRGSLINLVENPTEEELLAAIRTGGIGILENIPKLSKKLYCAALLRDPSSFLDVSGFEKLTDIFDRTEIANLLEQSPDVALALTEKDWDAKLLYSYLEKMVKDNRSELINDYQRRLHIPDQLKDSTFYRCYVMVDGYNIIHTPKDYIHTRLIRYSLENGTSFVGAAWLFEHIEEKFKTKDICLLACVKHFANLGHLPKEFRHEAFYEEVIAAGQRCMDRIDPKSVSLDYLRRLYIRGFYKSNSFPKDFWNQEVANEAAKRMRPLEDVPKKWQTREWYKIYVSHYGGWNDLPDNMKDADMAISCVSSKNRLALAGIPEAYKTPTFWETVIRNGKIEKVSELPKIYRTKEVIFSLAKAAAFYPYPELKEDAALPDEELEEVLLILLDKYPLHWLEIIRLLQTDRIKEKAYALQEPNYSRLYCARQMDTVPVQWMEELVPKYPEAILLKGITKELKEKSIELFPENALYEEIQAASEQKVQAIKKNGTLIPEEPLVSYQQLSIWDLLS